MQHFRTVLRLIVVILLVTSSQVYSRSPVFYVDQETDPVIVSSYDRALLLTVEDPYVLWPIPYGVQQTGTLNTTFDSYGTLGTRDKPWSYTVPSWPRSSFETPPGTRIDYLWMAGLWIGGIVGEDTLVSHGFEGWSQYEPEFRPINYPTGSVSRFEYPTGYSMRAVFSDTGTTGIPADPSGREHIPLHIKVSNRSHIWRSPGDQDIVIYDLVLTNIGDLPVEAAYIGLYVDADVGFTDGINDPWNDDLAGSLEDQEIGYIIDNDGDPISGAFDELTSPRKIIAVKMVGSSHPIAATGFNWWRPSYLPEYDFGPRMRGTEEDPFRDFGTGGLGVPDGDLNKYYMLSHPEWDYDQVYTASILPDDPEWLYPSENISLDLADGIDTKFLMSWGPVDLQPDSSTRVLLATFTADDVHVFPLNILNLPDHPYGYLANLNMTGVIANGDRAVQLATTLTDPALPVPGVDVVHIDQDSAVIEWDPWVFADVLGYEVYLSEVPLDQLPYPGVPAPWLRPEPLQNVASLGRTTSHRFTNLNPDKMYFVNIAHRSASGIGSEGVPLMIVGGGERPGPEPLTEYSYFYEGESQEIGWHPADNMQVDHYRVYKMQSEDEIAELFKPFYTEFRTDLPITPVDSFDIDETRYYYCAMEPYAVVAGGTTSFEDADPDDGGCYVITAVDINGFESAFSDPIISRRIYRPDRDILLLTNMPFIRLTSVDTVRNFYDIVLDGYDYDVYSFYDTVQKYGCDHEQEDCIDWTDFTRFKMTIVDIDSYDNIVTKRSEENFARIKNYILTGGRLAYFGCLYGMNSFYGDTSVMCAQEPRLVRPYLGVDSLYYYYFNYYYWSGLPLDVDSCFGFSYAEPVRGELPTIAYDNDRQTFADAIEYRWHDDTPPSVSIFVPVSGAETIYRYRSRYPESSYLEGLPVGIRTLTDQTDTYMFGFHLWYMEHESARLLIDELFDGLPTGIADDTPGYLPEKFGLRQNYPNPFNPSTVITFDLPRACPVSLAVYNILGQRVKTLIGGRLMPAGTHSIDWDGDGDRGDAVASGVYFYRLDAGRRSATRKMLLVK